MQEILDSLQPVLQQAQHVALDRRSIERFADSLSAKDILITELPSAPLPGAKDQKDYVAFLIIYASIVANTWGEPKWGVVVDGKKLGGSASIMYALRQALEKGYPLLSPAYLAAMPEEDLRQILASSDLEIPLFAERLAILHRLGSQITSKFDGSFWNILEQGAFSAPDIVRVLMKGLPDIFCDQVSHHGSTVQFHKLAQLAASMLIDLHEQGVLEPAISNEQELTALADYKVPQALQQAGMLVYSADLTEKLRSKKELPYGSDEEVEIRAFTIKAIDEAVKQARPRLPQATALRVDRALWQLSQKAPADALPHHRTRTTWY